MTDVVFASGGSPSDDVAPSERTPSILGEGALGALFLFSL
jgi:hypothetical protein